MSTIKVTNLQNASAASPAIVLDANSRATLNGLSYPTEGSLSGRNRIINGDMRIDQRNAGASVTPSSAAIAYCVDRFYTAAGSSVTGTLTVQRTATNLPGESQFCLRLARTSGTYSGTIYIGQTVETANCYDLAGKTITVSFRARKGSAYSASTIGVNCYTGTVADQGAASGVAGTWTGFVNLGSTTFTPTTSFATYSTTFTIGASVQEIQINFTTGSFSGTGGANDYIEITDVQLEAGSVATPFERRSYGQELALCQRYFETSYEPGNAIGSTTNPTRCIGWYAQATGSYQGARINFAAYKRSQPTMTMYNPSTSTSAQIRNFDLSTNLTGEFNYISVTGFQGNVYSTSVTQAHGLGFHYTASAEL